MLYATGFRIVKALVLAVWVTVAVAASGNAAAPPNDNFANRRILTGTSVEVTGSNVNASLEPGELSFGQARTVWYSWTAPVTAYFDLQAVSTEFLPVVIVFIGDSFPSLQRESSGQYGVWLSAVAGTTYHISVDSIDHPGVFVLRLFAFPPPANDHFTNRTTLHGVKDTGSSSSWNATSEPGEPIPFPNLSLGDRTSWWSWAAPSSGLASLNRGRSLGEAYLPVFGIYTGESLPTLSEVATGYQPIFPVRAGTTYQIQANLGMWGGPGPFTIQLALDTVELISPTNWAFVRVSNGVELEALPLDSSVVFTQVTFIADGVTVGAVHARPYAFHHADAAIGPHRYEARATDTGGITTTSGAITVFVTPDNDDFAQRIELNGPFPSIRAEFTPATSEPGEIPYPTNYHRVWYTWTAPFDGLARAWTECNLQTYTIAYTGEALAKLKPVAADAFGVFKITEGTTYPISVGSDFQWTDPGLGSLPPAILHLRSWQPAHLHIDTTQSRLRQDTRFEIPFYGSPGDSIVVEVSTNLIHWLGVATNAIPSGFGQYLDPVTNKQPKRFYRLRSLPAAGVL